MSICKWYSDKTKYIYFYAKWWKLIVSDKYMTTWEKVSSIIKIITVNNIKIITYNIKNLKAEKRFSTKESFQCFYVPVILFDSAYKKDRNYFLKVFLEKFIHNYFWRSIINFGF